jgi:hypothetical protein
MNNTPQDTDAGRAPTGQALAVPVEPASGLAPAGFDPSRKLGQSLRSLSYEQLVAECCYRGAELVIERTRNGLASKRFNKALERAWTDFLDANPDDLTSDEEYPDHALVTFEQMAGMVASAIEAGTDATPQSGAAEGESVVPQGDAHA